MHPNRVPLPLAVSASLVLFALPPAGARAELHPDAAAAVQRYVDATGGSAAIEAEQSLHVRGRIEANGLDGTWELWTAAPDRWMRSISLGPLQFRTGFDGTTAWRTDLSGRNPTALSQIAARDAREEGWFLNERWSRLDQGGGKILPRSQVFGAKAIYEVFEVTPPTGKPRRMFVNVKTGFIERVVGESDQYAVEERPSEYKLLAGRKRPTVFAAPTFLPTDKPIERMIVDSVWTNPALDSAVFSMPVVESRQIAWKKSQSLLRVPFQYDSKSVLVKVSINGSEPADFILDTGASLTAIDPEFADRVGLVGEGSATVQGIASTGGMKFASVKSIALTGAKGQSATLKDFRAALVSLAKGNKVVLWRNAVGLLGADFLSHFVVEIDYDSSRVTLYDPETFHYAGNGAALPFEIHGGIPVVEMSLDNGCSGKFIVDVGNAFHFTVHGSLVRSCEMIRNHGPRREVEVMGGGIGGGFVSTLCRLDSVQLGPYRWSHQVAALALHRSGMIGSEDFAGNIGSTVLEKFRCTFDYPRRTLYLEPGARFGREERVSRFGALLARVGAKVYAGNILSGSAAYDAGLRWYDEIVAIDDRPLDQWTRAEVDRLLEEGDVGSVHRITYRRLDDAPTTIEITLKDVL